MTLLEQIVKTIGESRKGGMSELELSDALEIPPHLIHPTIVMMQRRGLLVSLVVDWGLQWETAYKRVYRLSRHVRENYERTRPTR